ncbi:acetate/propionate family kinase [Chitinophaga sp.]|uniref:acetate/propionate family kinase n=1 Tax=Chitinophaga sp. TaxID=1869181 RepID=UPI0031D3AA91
METILTVNCGSSSLKFALYTVTLPLKQVLLGNVKNGVIEIDREIHEHGVGTMKEAVEEVLSLLRTRFEHFKVVIIGHRIVQGGEQHFEPVVLDDAVLQTLKELVPLAPLHLPPSLDVIYALQRAFPAAKQVGCFDTAFHQHMPFEARYYPLPRALWKEGVIHYGFHGLSYESIMQQLQPLSPGNKVIVAHLGNGASCAAVQEGRSVDTTMGMTPAGGLMMSARAGDLDPGVLLYLLEEKGMTSSELSAMLNKSSGLKAVSGESGDVQRLLELEDTHPQAAEAIHMFCYHARKTIGALAAVLGGVDTLVFTGGIGEHAPVIRSRICKGLEFLGIVIDEKANVEKANIISANDSTATVRVMITNEELMIAQHTQTFI